MPKLYTEWGGHILKAVPTVQVPRDLLLATIKTLAFLEEIAKGYESTKVFHGNILTGLQEALGED